MNVFECVIQNFDYFYIFERTLIILYFPPQFSATAVTICRKSNKDPRNFQLFIIFIIVIMINNITRGVVVVSCIFFRGSDGTFSLRGFQTVPGPTQPPIQWIPETLSTGQSGRGVKLTTHFHVVSRLRICGVI